MGDWKLIDTAPIEPFNVGTWFKSATPVLLLWDGHIKYIGWYAYNKHGKGKWQTNSSPMRIPTHWMPLPEPPK